MTRFIMSIREAVHLVLDSAILACGGEVFVTKMPTIRIQDLAEVMIRELAPDFGHDPERIGIRVIGTKPGEKMYEELMNDEETRRSWELERYFAVLPAFTCVYRENFYDYDTLVSKEVDRAYHSGNETPLTQEALLDFLTKNHLLREDVSSERHPAERYWPSGGCRE
jgi:FlaA1/EpsC-like NDP-sugar epimerase